MGSLLLTGFSLLTTLAYTTSFPAGETLIGADSESQRIINGKPANPGQFPYIVRIGYFEVEPSICTGALITESSVLSAAHCLVDENDVMYAAQYFEGLLGSVERGISETKITFREIRMHEEYDGNVLNDIAILIPKEPVNFPIIALPRKGSTFDGEKVVAVGWGYYQFGDTLPSNVLRYVEAKVDNSFGCYYLAKQLCIIHLKENVCTGSGDSGGPLVKKGSGTDISIGVLSHAHTEDECDQYMPEVYMSTSGYHDWIKQNAVGEITYA